MAIVGVEKIAQALNLTKSRIQQLVQEGLPKEARGEYDPVKCMIWYIRFLQRAIEKKTQPTLDGGFLGEREERVRLLHLNADLAEMELSKQRSQLVSIEDVEKAWADLVSTTTATMMAVVPRLAPQLLGETSRVMVHAKIEKALQEALLRLSKRKARRVSCE